MGGRRRRDVGGAGPPRRRDARRHRRRRREVFKHTGDGICAVFPSAAAGLAGAFAAQQQLAGGPLRGSGWRSTPARPRCAAATTSVRPSTGPPASWPPPGAGSCSCRPPPPNWPGTSCLRMRARRSGRAPPRRPRRRNASSNSTAPARHQVPAPADGLDAASQPAATLTRFVGRRRSCPGSPSS